MSTFFEPGALRPDEPQCRVPLADRTLQRRSVVIGLNMIECGRAFDRIVARENAHKLRHDLDAPLVRVARMITLPVNDHRDTGTAQRDARQTNLFVSDFGAKKQYSVWRH
jgi:hypothetical protein